VTIWERLEHSRHARTLEHRQIAEAAIAIADDHGLDAVSMRRLANVLGVATMALYRYVASKEDILWLMVDAAIGSGDDPDGKPDDWRVVVRHFAKYQRAALVRHPWLFEVGARIAIHLTPNRMALTEHALASLDGLGLDVDTQMAILGTVSCYVWGASGSEMAMAMLMRNKGWETRDDLRKAYGSQMSWLMSTGQYPRYHHYIHNATRKDDAAWRFGFGLDCLIEGIAAHLAI
jgi:AcrR family transcriptional regulator